MQRRAAPSGRSSRVRHPLPATRADSTLDLFDLGATTETAARRTYVAARPALGLRLIEQTILVFGIKPGDLGVVRERETVPPAGLFDVRAHPDGVLQGLVLQARHLDGNSSSTRPSRSRSRARSGKA